MDPDDFLDVVRGKVARHGHMIQQVLPASDDDGCVPFCYTVGLLDRWGFEAIVTGLGVELGAELLNTLAAEWRAGPPPRGCTLARIIRPPYLPVLIDAAPRPPYTVGVADAFYGYDRAVPVAQLVVPDAAYRYPWNPRCNDGHPELQPLLGAKPEGLWE